MRKLLIFLLMLIFLPMVTSASMGVNFHVIGQGQFYIFKNGDLQQVAYMGSNGVSNDKTVYYDVGDNIVFIAYPYLGYHVGSVCDVPQTECRYEESYTYEVIGQLPTQMNAWFVADTSPTPTPAPTPTPTPLPQGDFSVHVIGDGYVTISVGSGHEYLGSLGYGESGTFNSSVGTNLWIQDDEAGSGWHYDRVCSDANCYVHSHDTLFSALVSSTTQNYYVYFLEDNPAPVPTLPPAPDDSKGTQSLGFEVIGQGQFYALRNGAIEALATPGHNVNVSYAIGDTIGFSAYAYLNNHLANVCDVPYTECQTQTAYTFVVTGNLPNKMVATFQSNSSNGSMPVIFHTVGEGQIYVFKNGSMEALSTLGHDVTVSYEIGDTIGFTAYPDHNNTLVSMCDYPLTECNTELGYSYTVIGQLPDKMIATFTSHNSNSVPTTTPQPTTQTGSTPYTPSEDTMSLLNRLNELLGLFSFVPPLVGLLISAIATGAAYIYGRMQGSSDIGMVLAVLATLVEFATGLLAWWIFLLVVIVVIAIAYANSRSA